MPRADELGADELTCPACGKKLHEHAFGPLETQFNEWLYNENNFDYTYRTREHVRLCEYCRCIYTVKDKKLIRYKGRFQQPVVNVE